MHTGELLLRAILSDPADDTARLVYADWLEENGEEKRAEFIRKQIRLHRMSGSPSFDAERDEVRTWLMRCIGNGYPALWVSIDLGLGTFDWSWSGDETDTLINTATGIYAFSRGLLYRVALPCADFLKHARDIFAAHPVTEVRLTDCTPEGVGGEVWWYDNDGDPFNPQFPANLPDALFGVPPPSRWLAEPFSTDLRAHEWLSARCVAYGRSLAGLPPLPVHQPA